MSSVQELAILIREQVAPSYPSLHVGTEGDFVFIKGLLPIVHDGNELDRFDVAIEIPSDYPRLPPRVWEVGGRIPKTQDRHCGKGGVACLMIEEEYWFDGWDKKSFIEFLNGPVRSYFVYQLTVEEGMEWPHGQRPHGGLGIAEFYGDRFGISDAAAILHCLQLTRLRELKGHQPCPCGSAKKIRSCHPEWRKVIESIKQKLPTKQISQTIDHLLLKQAALSTVREMNPYVG